MGQSLRSVWTVALAAVFATPAAAADVAISVGQDGESVAVSPASDASVNEDPANSSQSEWQFAVTPYLWMAGVSGEVGLAPGEEVDVDTKFTDILSALKFAAMGAFEARRDRFVVLGDVIYLSMGVETDGPNDTSFVSADVDTRIFIGTIVAGYRVVDQGPLFVDLFAGGRLTSLDVGVELDGPFQTLERDRSKSSIAPVLGGRLHAPIGDRWGIGVYGDVGGFGASADMTWQLMGTIQYDLSDRWRASAGYRHVSIHHDKNDFEVDLQMSGPILGFSYRF